MTEREIFLSALEIEDLAAREEHIRTACAGNAALLARVELLLNMNDSQSQFLQTPVVAQMGSTPDADAATTIRCGTGSTEDEDVPSESLPGDGKTMVEKQDDESDEIPLGYLQPSDNPRALGRLAHYEILEVLGRGAFGIVLKAMDEKLQRVVAIKMLSPEMAATSPARKRFLREARSSAAVRHEHVVNIYAVEEEPIPYLVMEYIPGQTLQQRLESTGPLPVTDVLRLGRQIAEGLAAAGAQGLIHRDIKPGNILLEAGVHERVKITDFGLARAADDATMTQSGVIAGTPMYMAPEQALGKTLDQRADLFSMGSVLYQMVSGRAPFRAASTLAVLKRVTEDTPRPIQEIIPETPRWLCDIITKLHAKDPDDRFQTAEEVAEVLADCEAQLKANAKLLDYSRIPKMNSASGSGRWKWVAAAALFLPLLALSATETAGVTQWFRSSSTSKSELVTGGGPVTPNPVTPNAVTNPEPSPIASKISPGSSDIPTSANILTSDEYEWTKPVNLGPNVNSAQQDSELWISADGLRLLFNSDRPGGAGSCDLWECRRSRVDEAWSAAVNLGEPVNSVWFDVDPQLSADGRTLVFVSSRNDNTVGGLDLWLATRESADAAWKKPVNLGPRINSPQVERHPVLSPDGLQLIFASNRDGKSWGPWTTSRNSVDEEWSVPVQHPGAPSPINQLLDAQNTCLFEGTLNDDTCGLARWNSVEKRWEGEYRFPPPINDGSGNGSPNYVPASQTLYFESARSGGQGGFDLWMSRRVKKTPPLIVPFTDADVQRIGALPAAKQVEEVRKELTRRNPDFDGKMETKIEDGVVTEIDFVTDHVSDIAPIRVFNALRVLNCYGTNDNGKPNGLLVDLTPLERMNLAALTQLNLDNTKVGDAGLRVFKDCRNLLTLRLWNTKVTDAGLANFKDCKNLTLLGLIDTRISDSGLADFNGLTDLTVLGLSATWISDAGLANFKACKNLTYLNLGGTQITDAGLVHFKGCNKLTELQLSDLPQIGDAGLVHFQDCHGLTRLKLSRTKMTDVGLAYFKDCHGLTLLHVDGTQVTDAGLAIFKVCHNLTNLSIAQTQVTGTGLANFKGMRLTTLYMDNAAVTDLNSLQGMPLEVVYLTPKNILKGLDTLRDMKSLKTIGIGWNQPWPAAEFWARYDIGEFGKAFTDAEVHRIAALPAAEQVEEVRKELMRRNPGFDGRVEYKIEDGVVTDLRVVTDKVTDIAPIRVFNALRALDLSGTELDRQGNGQLADLSPLKDMNLSSLTYLSLACTKIDDVGLACFRNCNNLTGLWLSQTRVTNAGLANFEGCQKLQVLNLKYTQVDDAGLAHFKGCKDLNGVDFGGLNVTDEGLAYFKDCKGLAHLWLNDTRVTDVGLAYFKDCTTLTHLHLGGTQVTNDALANFRDCKDLTLVLLESTRITDAGLVHLKNCKKLWKLNLIDTSVTAGAIEELKKTHPKCRIEWDGGVIDP